MAARERRRGLFVGQLRGALAILQIIPSAVFVESFATGVAQVIVVFATERELVLCVLPNLEVVVGFLQRDHHAAGTQSAYCTAQRAVERSGRVVQESFSGGDRGPPLDSVNRENDVLVNLLVHGQLAGLSEGARAA